MASSVRHAVFFGLMMLAGAVAPAFSQAFPGCSEWTMVVPRPADVVGPPWIDWFVADVARGDGLFVALVFDRSRGALVLTSRDGKTWHEGQLLTGPERLPLLVTFAGGKFVAFVGCDEVFVSTNAEEWQGGTIGGCADMAETVWTGSELLAVGGIGGAIIASGDGLNWTLRYDGPPPYWVDAQPAGYRPLESIAWSGSLFAASGFLHLVTSTDGGAWAAIQPPKQTGYDDITWTGRRFVAVAGGTVMTSTDGVSWESHAVPNPGAFAPLIWTGADLVARSGACLYRSADGVTWTADECLPQEAFDDFTHLLDFGDVQFAVSNAGLYRRTCSGRGLVLPGAAHVTGVGGSQWRTDVDLFSIGNTLTTVHVGLHPWGSEGPPAAERTLTLPPGRSLHLDDVVQNLFGQEGAATLTLTPVGGTITAQARTYADSPAGTYGQFISAVPDDAAAAAGDEIWLAGLKQAASDDEGYRTDLGLVNVSHVPVDLTVTFFTPERTELGELSYHLRPEESFQITKVLTRVTADPVLQALARITTDTTDGRFLAYASVIDNRTNDPVYIPGP